MLWRPLAQAVGWVVSVGIVATDEAVRRRQRFVNTGAVLGAIASTQHAVEQWLAGEAMHPLAVHNAIFAVVHLITPLFHRVSANAAAIWLCSAIILGTQRVIWLTGLDGGAQVYFACTAGAFLFFGPQNWRLYVAVVAAAFASVIGALALAPLHGPVAVAAPAYTRQLASLVVINVMVINVWLFTYALLKTYRAEAALGAEVERADRLLLAILPRPIARTLKGDPKALVADRHEAVTIFFADLVGFTSAARTASPERLVAWLDGLFKAVDALAETHKVEKIKTIGDAYMAVSGVQVPPEVGADRVAGFAIAFRDLVRATPGLDGGPLNARVGIHTGPVVAGVIGGTRFAYDLWGDAVNTASRMESHGAPDKIQISAATRALLSKGFETLPRGSVAVKGLGAVDTFWLETRAADLSGTGGLATDKLL
ncbi:adenylate/guanylate cyclase domain-containing protein [Acuticoccus sp. MNP-M23]|uniref:adenylate/guanylate cyclase domain-containing protein n=1 Tax=Acuticoccus sp. MNP-M23 TaxID=3072793 RepID=UPI002814A555|nr:adenylate/guanylate cyclase domain-containing protein [Acuticoccus sp. MNP-M23]WMS44777.1 adenylate/guanylate cyclase domain-containing protein [Acuticoccus sp. MNP-M23]